MTIEHIVLLEKKDDATDEQTQAALAGIKSLKEKIPGVLEVKISDNITDRAPYSHGAIITMQDRETLAGIWPPSSAPGGTSALATRRCRSRRGGHRDLISLFKSADQVIQSQFFALILVWCEVTQGQLWHEPQEVSALQLAICAGDRELGKILITLSGAWNRKPASASASMLVSL